LNIAKGIHATITFAGGAVVLLVWHDVVLFAAWLVLSAALELGLYLGAVRASTPDALAAGPRPAVLSPVWRYAWTIAVIGALSLILTQSDRIVLARLVTTAKLGEYV